MMTIHFLLTPDKAASRKVRRALAEQAARLGVMVGTWPELVNLAQKTFLLIPPEEEWQDKLESSLEKIAGAFWLESMMAAPIETTAAIGNALVQLVEGVDPEAKISPSQDDDLPPRLSRRIADLARLHEKMDFALPPNLAMIRQVIAADSSHALNSIVVYHVDGFPCLNPRQRAFLEKLDRDFMADRDHSLQDLLDVALHFSPGGAAGSSLSVLQRNLFDSSPEETLSQPESVQWLAVRDVLEELEVVAGMIQKALQEDTNLTWSDFALLFPSDPLYPMLAQSVFSCAGLPLSGLPMDALKRDLGREVLHAFLVCCRKPAPLMAFASLVSSPLMPWGEEEGMVFAQKLMDGYQFTPGEENHRELLGAVERTNLQHGPKALAANLEKFVALLACPEGMEGHFAQMRETAAAMVAALREDKGFDAVFRMATPEHLDDGGTVELTVEGIAVFNEHEEAWRSVRRLYVFGFSDGHYPASEPHSPVFFDDELALLRERLGYELRCADDETSKRRSLFRRQLTVASERLVFTLPGRDLTGEPVAPSSSLPFMAALFDDVDAPEDIICSLATENGRSWAAGVACAVSGSPEPPRELGAADLRLGLDLLKLRTDEKGNPKPESPSGLEKLMVSPLAWLLDRTGLKPYEWKPEALDVALRGTLAHDVFEYLFQLDIPLPDAADIPARIPGLFAEAVHRKAPFLAGSEWHVERSHLEREITDAAQFWSRFLAVAGATILGNEEWLRGDLDGTPVHGKADLLISLPGNRLVVVDYKKSSSTSRRERMQKRYDSQASLYRIMLETGGGFNDRNERLATALNAGPKIGVLYYMLNDQGVLADTDGWLGAGLEGVRELAGDISSEAMKRIRDRILEVRKGLVALNREDDEKWYEKNAGIKLYALDDSPLVRLFMRPAEGGDA